MKHPANRTGALHQATPDIEGYVVDLKTGARWRFGGAPKAPFWSSLCTYDEGMVGVQGCYTLLICKGKPIPINAGKEYVQHTA